MKIKIVCHHCGRDYAREFWLSGGSFEHPFVPGVTKLANHLVCPSCCRDTNPDAADAPHWEPRAHTDDQSPSPVFVVSPGRKQCRVCRVAYDGLIFGSPVSKGATLPFGICPQCERADDLAHAPVVPYTVSVRE